MAPSADVVRQAIGLIMENRVEAARTILERLLAEQPACADALNLLGTCAGQAGRTERAAALFRHAHAVVPGSPAVRRNLAAALALCATARHAAGLGPAALAACREALALEPGEVRTWVNLAEILERENRPEEQAAALRNAVALAPDHPGLPLREGQALFHLRRYDAAAASCRRAIRLHPASARGRDGLGAALHAMERYDPAHRIARQAVALAPETASRWQNLAVAAVPAGRFDDTIPGWRRACLLDPQDAVLHWQHAFALLRGGRLEEGWLEYEWRWAYRPDDRRRFDRPAWTGGDLQGKTILIHHEQGLGDAVQFVRFAPLLKRLGARTVMECPRPLLRLLRTAPGVDQWVAVGEEPPPFDTYVPLMSLPGLLGIAMATIPAPVPYLTAEPERIGRWSRRLGPAAPGELRVGLIWQGSAVGGRSLPLAALAPLGAIPGVRLIGLQKGEGSEQVACLPAGMRVEVPGDWESVVAAALRELAAGPINST